MSHQQQDLDIGRKSIGSLCELSSVGGSRCCVTGSLGGGQLQRAQIDAELLARTDRATQCLRLAAGLPRALGQVELAQRVTEAKLTHRETRIQPQRLVERPRRIDPAKRVQERQALVVIRLRLCRGRRDRLVRDADRLAQRHRALDHLDQAGAGAAGRRRGLSQARSRRDRRHQQRRRNDTRQTARHDHRNCTRGRGGLGERVSWPFMARPRSVQEFSRLSVVVRQAAQVAWLAVTALAVSLAPALVHADDWPQFRGPAGQGGSAETGLPLQWSEVNNVSWKVPIAGRGWSSPVVAGDRVWLTTAVDEGDVTLRALAFDVESGRQVVNTEVFRMRKSLLLNMKNSWASPTPIIEGDRVYVHFGAEGTAALTTDGQVVWQARFPYQSQHGGGGSPALYGDLLIFSCDGSDTAFVIALDKRTGKVRWKTPRRQPADQAYSTPLIIRVGDRDQVVSVGAYRTVAYDPESGREIWRVSYEDGFSNVPRPVFGHGMVFISTGFQEPSLLAVRVDGVGDVTGSHIAWTLARAAPHTPSPLLVEDLLYVVSDVGVASCLDARTGALKWRQRLEGSYSASPVFADGRIYFQNEEGLTSVIKPGLRFEQLATSELDGSTLASMAVSHGSFFLRTGTHLYRIKEAAHARP
jgi:outer membrane protein assembly factor BamB